MALLAGDEDGNIFDDGELLDRLAASIKAGILATQAAGVEHDAALFAAERELEKLRAGTTEADGDQMWAVEQKIAQLAPNTLAGAAVKLRRLGDPEIGIEAGATRTRARFDRSSSWWRGCSGKEMEQCFSPPSGRSPRQTGSPSSPAMIRSSNQSIGYTMRPNDFIELTEPQSLAGVAVKLRRLFGSGGALDGFDREIDSVRQCIAFLDREIAATAQGEAAPPEPEVIRFGEPEPRQ